MLPWKFVTLASTFEFLPGSTGASIGWPLVMIAGVMVMFVVVSLPFGSVTVTFSISPALTVPSFGTVIRTLDVFISVSFPCSTLLKVWFPFISFINLTVGVPGIILTFAPLSPLSPSLPSL